MNIKPPILPIPTTEYSVRYMEELLKSLDLFFRGLSTPIDLRAATLRFETKSLPTDDDYDDIRVGDVYVDTSADNVLKVKL